MRLASLLGRHHHGLSFLFVLFTVAQAFLVSAGEETCVNNVQRGGFDPIASAEASILQFLSRTQVDDAKFLIQGWRWHTMSFARECKRLGKLASSFLAQDTPVISEDDRHPVKQAVDYVVGFNMRGLHRVEGDLFFPWMREKFSAVEETELAKAFETIMDQMEKDRQIVSNLGAELETMASILDNPKTSEPARNKAVANAVQTAEAMVQYAQDIQRREDAFLVPAIARLVPISEQKSFNFKVQRKLGLLDSRLHLVGMHEAIKDSKSERAAFEQEIPYVAQKMIPRWKRLLYDPQAGVLENFTL